jgi:uncharacterized membrane protein
MNRLKLLISQRRNDERGVTLIIVAVAMSLLFPVAIAFSVELGQDTVLNRSLQGAADAGALDAAQYLGVSTASVQSQGIVGVTDNYSDASSTITEGMWSGSSFTASTTCESSNSCNAVMATAGASVNHFFQAGGNSLSRSAVAANVPAEAGFSIGTDLLSLTATNKAILDPLLSTLGASVNLTLVGYQGMAGTDVTVQQLINASGGLLTPTNVLSASLTSAQWASILNTAVASLAAGTSCSGTSTPPACASSQLSVLASDLSTSGTVSASLCQMVSINGSTCSSTLSASALSASLNVLQTLTTEAELANKTNALTLNASLLGGLTTLKTTLIQIPQVAYGPIGTTASTGQVNVAITIAGIASIGVTAATGTAQFTSGSCSSGSMTTTLTTNTSAATVTVGLSVLGIIGIGIPVTVTGVTNDALIFPQPPPPTSQTVGSTNPGLGGLSGALTALVNPLLQSLGVSVANADVTDSSATCAGVQLVQ